MNVRTSFLARAFALALAGASAGLLTSCGAETEYADPQRADPDGGVGVASKDIIDATTQATTDILTKVKRFQIDGKAPLVAFYSIQNNSSQALNKDLLLRRIRSTMMDTANGKMRFLNEAALQRIDQERAAKRAGQVTATQLKQLLGADFLLTGAIDSLTESQDRHKSNYVLMTFRLTDCETGEVVWEKPYEFKKTRTDSWWN